MILLLNYSSKINHIQSGKKEALRFNLEGETYYSQQKIERLLAEEKVLISFELNKYFLR